MKQVNRKFLEEQVRKALHEEPGGLFGDSPMDAQARADRKKAREALSSAGSLVREILISIPFGSPQSWADMKSYLEGVGAYGFGADKYYKMALDEIGNIENENARAPYSQLMLRFYQTTPITTDSELEFETLNLVPRDDIANELVDVKKYGYSKILPILRSKNSNEEKVEEIEDFLKTMGHRNAISTLDESLDDIADSYGFKESEATLWGTSIRSRGRTLFKEPAALEKAGLYKDLAKDILKIGNKPKALELELEKFIMFHFNGLEGVGFQKGMLRMQFNSNLPKVAKAQMAYQTNSELGAKALIGLLDASTSTISTIALVVSMVAAVPTAGASVGGAVAVKAGQRMTIAAARKVLLKYSGVSSLAKGANALNKAKTYKNTIGRFNGLKYQLSPLFVMFGQWRADEWAANRNNIEKNNQKFFEEYENATPEQRAAYFDTKIKSSIKYIATEHAKILNAAGFDLSKAAVSVRVANPGAARNEYIKFNKEYILQMQENIKQTEDALKGAQLQAEVAAQSVNLHEEAQKKIAQADAVSMKQLKREVPKIPISNVFAAPMPVIKGDSEKTKIEKEKEKTEFGSKEVSSDEILKNIKTSFGSNEQTSASVLRDLENELAGSNVNEATDSQTITVNVGYKDALEHAKGNEDFTVEKTKKNIQKIAKLVSNKGKKLNITALPKMTKDTPGVDAKKFNDFVKQINSYIQKKEYSSMTAPVQPKIEPPKEKPSEKKVDAKQLATDDVIIIGDSNSMPFSKRWFKRGKTVKRKGGVYLMDGDNIVSPSVSGGTVPTILSATKTFFQQKGDSYKPSIAIVHMGYNAPGGAFPAYQETINFLKQKGVQDIRVVDVKVAGNTYASSKAKEKAYMRSIQKVSEKIRALSGVTVIANNEQNNVKGDKLHFTTPAYNNLYNAAMSGVSSAPVSSISKPKPSASSGKLNVGDPRSTEMISDVQKYLKRELTADESENLNKIYDAAIQNVSYVKDRNAWNAIRRAYGTKESGNNYNPYKSTGSWKKNRYTGRYAIGPAPYKIAREIVSKFGVNMPNYKYISSREWSPGSQEKYYNNPIAQEASFLGFVLHNKKMVSNQAEDSKDEMSLPGIAHNIGPGGMRRWAEYRTQYRKTKDKQYLYKMWSLQDGNGTPGENFMRILLRKTGGKVPDLPMGFFWSGGIKKNDYKHLEKIKQFDPDLGNFIEQNYAKKWHYDKRIFAFSEGNYAEKLWNWVTTSGQNTFSKRNAKRISTNIEDYYNENGDPIGSPGGDFRVGAATVSPTKLGQPTGQKPKEDKKVTDTANLDTQIANIAKADNYDDFISLTTDLFGGTLGSMMRKTSDIIRAESRLQNTNLSEFVQQRIDYLKSLHRDNLSLWNKEYKEDIKAADGNKEQIEVADKKMAWFHRPIFYVTIFPNDLKKFFANSATVSFGFEPNTNRISTSYRGRETFYKEDTSNNAAYKRFLSELSLLKKATNTIVKKIDALMTQADPKEEENLKIAKKYMKPMDNVVSSTLSGLNERGIETSRKAYLVSILDLALRTT